MTPYFPPQSRVGALRPLKFVRHLREFGWDPVVLADLKAKDRVDPRLEDAIPDETVVVREYSAAAKDAAHRLEASPRTSATRVRTSIETRRWWERGIFAALDNPEVVPLGEHSLDIPHAVRAGRRALRRHAGCEAIMVNADPYAAMLVGDRLGREHHLPVIHDLRDPWVPCELRRPLRPAISARVVEALERRVVLRAARVILNTRRARDDYRDFYPDVPRERFAFIRNGFDRELIGHGEHRGFDRFTLLFLGNFRRFLGAKTWIDVLGLVAGEGVTAEQLQFVVTGSLPEEAQRRAAQAGVLPYIQHHGHVPQTEILPFMRSADLLIAVTHGTAQRIPAKIYDYLAASRPILVAGDNPELAEVIGRSGRVFAPSDVQGLASAVLAAFRGNPLGEGAEHEASSARAGAAELAKILDDATG